MGFILPARTIFTFGNDTIYGSSYQGVELLQDRKFQSAEEVLTDRVTLLNEIERGKRVDLLEYSQLFNVRLLTSDMPIYRIGEDDQIQFAFEGSNLFEEIISPRIQEFEKEIKKDFVPSTEGGFENVANISGYYKLKTDDIEKVLNSDVRWFDYATLLDIQSKTEDPRAHYNQGKVYFGFGQECKKTDIGRNLAEKVCGRSWESMTSQDLLNNSSRVCNGIFLETEENIRNALGEKEIICTSSIIYASELQVFNSMANNVDATFHLPNISLIRGI